MPVQRPRRLVLALAGSICATGGALALDGPSVSAPSVGAPSIMARKAPAPDATIDMAKAVAPGDWPAIATLGAPDAKVTVVEFGSYTSRQTAAFARNVWPAIKAAYVDTGKVRFVYREHARDGVDFAAALAARCGVEKDLDRAWTRAQLVLERQFIWAPQGKPVTALLAQLAPFGLATQAARACIIDKKAYKAAVEQTQAQSRLGVTAVPAFAVDGKLYSSEISVDAAGAEAFAALLEAALAAAR